MNHRSKQFSSQQCEIQTHFLSVIANQTMSVIIIAAMFYPLDLHLQGEMVYPKQLYIDLI